MAVRACRARAQSSRVVAQHRLEVQPASVWPGHWIAAALALSVQPGAEKAAQLGGLQHTRLVQAPPRQAMLAAGVLVLRHQPSVQVWEAQDRQGHAEAA